MQKYKNQIKGAALFLAVATVMLAADPTSLDGFEAAATTKITAVNTLALSVAVLVFGWIGFGVVASWVGRAKPRR